MKKLQMNSLPKKANQKTNQDRQSNEKALKYHSKFQILYLQKRHKTEPHPPKSLFKSEDDENFSLYVSEVTFPLTDT